MKRILCITLISTIAACSSNSDKDDFFSTAENGEKLSGGDTTTKRLTSTEGFSEAANNLISFGTAKLSLFESGDTVFNRNWVKAPANGQPHHDGVGPLFNTASCQGCHIKDARGHAPAQSGIYDFAESMLVRVSIPYSDSRTSQEQKDAFDAGEIPVIPHPIYGGQFQDRSINDFKNATGEGDIQVSWQESSFTYPDGQTIKLRKPSFQLVNLSFGDLADSSNPEESFELSPRISPQMIGLGLLEAIAAEDIFALEDINDSNNDGISGKANRVKDNASGETGILGRFGWKAGNPNLKQQSLGAFAGDMGVTSSFAQSTDCTIDEMCPDDNSGQSTGNNQGFELRDIDADDLVFYTQHLAVPARANVNDPEILAGKKHFYEAGCIQCHQPKFTTGDHPQPTLSNQLIWPYTDMLLHDMGPDLADNRPEFRANGQEWRTAPLWGLGLTRNILGNQTQFLHDGRAATIEEAILWHGGEAQQSKTNFSRLNQAEREQLIGFIQDL